jgi:membrane peptidoglycan carboxypeptidase
VAVVAGVLSAMLLLPWVGGIGLARDLAAGFMAMPHDLAEPSLSERVVLTDTDDRPIAEVGERERELVSLDEISPWVPAALMATEDERFYEHGGLDLRGTLRALLRTAQGDLQGGSTITQQYVKNLLIENADTEEEVAAASERTVTRKLVELRQAIAVEDRMTKDEIMEGYLNVAYFGEGAHGIEVAAQRYFSVSADELDPAQAALLIGLVRSPANYDPLTDPGAALERRGEVLDRMAETGHLTREEAEEYKAADLGLDPTPRAGSCEDSGYPFFCNYVMDWLTGSDLLGDTEAERQEALEQGGFTVRTTLDRDMQRAAQDAVDEYVPHEGSTKFATEALVEPGSGEVRALAQNLRYGLDDDGGGTTSINLAVDQAAGGSLGFQAGSTFKAFTLAAALDSGLGFDTSFSSPDSMTVDGMRDCDGRTMSGWNVRNAGESDAGQHDMLSGTQGSVNTYFAQLQREAGLCETAEMAETAGIARADGEPLGVYSSFTLGDQEVSPLTVANAYATFAARGTRCEPQPVRAIVDRGPAGGGAEPTEVESVCEEAVSPEVADGVNHLLQRPFDGGTADGLGIGRPAAGKTGTTDGAAYAWFAGYTPELASAVAVGDVRGGEQYPLEDTVVGGRHYGIVYGGTLPGPIWQETMRGATADLPATSFEGPPSAFGDPGGGSSGAQDGGGDNGGEDGGDGGGDGEEGGGEGAG